MNCRAYKDMLHSYEKDELNEIEKNQVTKHLEVCEACRSELQEIRKLKKLLGAIESEGLQLKDIKQNIMLAIQSGRKKLPAYDIKVLAKLGTSMVACGILVLLLNFTSIGSKIELNMGQIPKSLESTQSRLNQSMVFLNKGLSNISDTIVNLDGIMFRIQQKIEGGI